MFYGNKPVDDASVPTQSCTGNKFQPRIDVHAFKKKFFLYWGLNYGPNTAC
jgi:hypothetical protein